MTLNIKSTPAANTVFTAGRQGNAIEGIIIHWMGGSKASADAVFTSGSRDTSAHYGIEDDDISQYVSDDDTAWQAGDWDTNTKTIGIEHSAQPGRDASAITLENSAQLIASLAKKHGFAINRQTVRRHNEVIHNGAPVATQCCGTINVDALVSRANEVLGTVAQPVPAPQPAPAPQPSGEVTWAGVVTVGASGANIRPQPSTSQPPLHQNAPGTLITIVGFVHGENVNGGGNDIWLQAWNGNWVWSGAVDGFSNVTPVAKTGTVTVTSSLNVRSAPSISAPLSGSQHLAIGATVNYVDIVTGDNVNGNDRWYKSQFGNYFWSGGCQ